MTEGLDQTFYIYKKKKKIKGVKYNLLRFFFFFLPKIVRKGGDKERRHTHERQRPEGREQE